MFTAFKGSVTIKIDPALQYGVGVGVVIRGHADTCRRTWDHGCFKNNSIFVVSIRVACTLSAVSNIAIVTAGHQTSHGFRLPVRLRIYTGTEVKVGGYDMFGTIFINSGAICIRQIAIVESNITEVERQIILIVRETICSTRRIAHTILCGRQEVCGKIRNHNHDTGRVIGVDYITGSVEYRRKRSKWRSRNAQFVHTRDQAQEHILAWVTTHCGSGSRKSQVIIDCCKFAIGARPYQLNSCSVDTGTQWFVLNAVIAVVCPDQCTDLGEWHFMIFYFAYTTRSVGRKSACR